jgi:RNA polymerase sigma factor (sigma-70 family)
VLTPLSIPRFARGSRDELLVSFNKRFRLPLLAYFGRRVSSPAEAEDLTQDVFERLTRSLATKPVENPEAFVFHIAANLLRDRARRVRRHGTEELLPSDAVVDLADALIVDLSPERVVLGEKTLAEVLAVLDGLEPRTRAIFYLYRLENLKIREIAELYGVSASAIEKHVAKVLLLLTRRLHGGEHHG